MLTAIGSANPRGPSLRWIGWTVADLGRQGKANAVRFHLKPGERGGSVTVGWPHARQLTESGGLHARWGTPTRPGNAPTASRSSSVLCTDRPQRIEGMGL